MIQVPLVWVVPRLERFRLPTILLLVNQERYECCRVQVSDNIITKLILLYDRKSLRNHVRCYSRLCEYKGFMTRKRIPLSMFHSILDWTRVRIPTSRDSRAVFVPSIWISMRRRRLLEC